MSLRKRQWNDCLSMIPSIFTGLYQSYQFYPKLFILSPIVYTVSMAIACKYHFMNYRDNTIHIKWLRFDLISQSITIAVTTYFTAFGIEGTLAIIGMLWMSVYLDLESTPQRIYAYILNGIGCFLSTGTAFGLWMYWFLNFMVFNINFVFPNAYTHSLFHLIATHICYLTWQHSFIGNTNDNHRIIERHQNQTNDWYA